MSKDLVISEYVEIKAGKDKGRKGTIEGFSHDRLLYDVRLEDTKELIQYSIIELKSLFW